MTVIEARTEDTVDRWQRTWHRVLAATLVFLFAATGLMVIGHATDPATSHRLRTALDDAIPFVPWHVYIYSWVYTSMLYPIFVVRCPRLFRRTVIAYSVIVASSFLIFLVFPVTSIDLRPATELLDPTGFTEWAVLLTYNLDPPTNLFPSLHLSIATIAAICSWMASPFLGSFAVPIVVGIAITICTIKQHFVADGVAAFLLAIAVWAIVLRPYRHERAPNDERAFTWRGPVAYLAFHCAFYGAFVVAFLAGAPPGP